MSKNLVGQLPISPSVDPKLGYYMTPVAVDALSKFRGTSTVFATNNLGQKVTEGKSVNINLDYLSKLGIIPNNIWIDSDRQNLEAVKALLEKGLKEGWLCVDEREVYYCTSGMIEFIAAEESLHENNNGRTLYYVKSGIPYSTITGEPLVKELRKCLLLKLPQVTPDQLGINIYPDYGNSEFAGLVSNYSGRELLISRISDNKPLNLDFAGNSFPIDVDICWMPFLYLLQELSDLSIGSLLTSHRTIKQAVLSIMMAKLVGADLPKELIVLPKLKLDFGQNPQLTAEQLLSQFGPQVVKLLLVSTIGTRKKDLVLPSSLIHWIRTSLTGTILPLDSKDLDSLDILKYPISLELGAVLKLLRQSRSDNLKTVHKWLLNYVEA